MTAVLFNPPASRSAPPDTTPVAIARGDGIGPEIMDATLRILEAAGAPLAPVEIRVGERVYHEGTTSGIAPEAWQTLRATRVLLKAPITTPQGGGYKSLNVTLRKTLGLYANVRPCVSYHPFVATRHPGMDVVVIRENEEDTYAGIEHRQTAEVTQCLKLITRPGCERIARYAFEYARRNGRSKVSCFTKDNIMKLTDGLFHRVFDEVAADYPDIATEHRIVDIGAALLADQPERFDVILLPNLYGDILSDVAAQLTGSVGLAGSANIGEDVAMFEAIHGSAPDIAGQGIANPSGLLLSAVQMLVHLGQADTAGLIHNAWLRTIEDGVHTPDLRVSTRSARKVGTESFADEVIARLGQEPAQLRAAHYAGEGKPLRVSVPRLPEPVKKLVGVDVFLDWDDAGRSPEILGHTVGWLAGDGLILKMITNRGVKVFPGGAPETFCTDHWRCRFVAAGAGKSVTHQQVHALLGRFIEAGLDVIKTENLFTFDGVPGYTLGQGE